MAESKTNILIIDDDRVSQLYLLELIKTILPDVSVTKTDSGQQAIELIHKKHFHYIFTDIMMPGLSGENLLKKLTQAIAKNQECKIYAISGISEASKDETYNNYTVRFLEKPVDQNILKNIFHSTEDPGVSVKDTNTPKSNMVIHPAKIEKLYKNQPEKLIKILQLYIETLPSQINNLTEAWKNNNEKAMHNAAHSLKNSFTYLGADFYKALAAAIENSTEKKLNTATIDQHIKQISSAETTFLNNLKELIIHYEQ